MVLLKYKVDPSAQQATINVSLSTTPTLSLSDPAAALDLTLTISIASSPSSSSSPSSTQAAGRPITIMVEKTVFEVHDPEEGGLDILSQGAFGVLRSTTGDGAKNISLGHFKINSRSKSESPDLRERGHRFLTIPGDGSPVTVTHRLSWDRILKYEGKRAGGRGDVSLGESFDIGMQAGYLGTMWWCWGDMETDLKGKRLHVWHAGPFAGDRPDEEFVRDGNWVLGEEPMLLDWKDVTEGGQTRFEVVE